MARRDSVLGSSDDSSSAVRPDCAWGMLSISLASAAARGSWAAASWAAASWAAAAARGAGLRGWGVSGVRTIAPTMAVAGAQCPGFVQVRATA